MSLQIRSWHWRRRILQALTNTSYPLAPWLLTLSAIRLTWRSIGHSLLREGTVVISMKEHDETGKTRCLAIRSAFNFVRLIIPRRGPRNLRWMSRSPKNFQVLRSAVHNHVATLTPWSNFFSSVILFVQSIFSSPFMEPEGELSCLQISPMVLILNVNLDSLPQYFTRVLIFSYRTGRIIRSGLSSQIVNSEKLHYPRSLYELYSPCLNKLNILLQINLLKTKPNLLYIMNQFVPRSKRFPPRL